MADAVGTPEGDIEAAAAHPFLKDTCDGRPLYGSIRGMSTEKQLTTRDPGTTSFQIVDQCLRHGVGQRKQEQVSGLLLPYAEHAGPPVDIIQREGNDFAVPQSICCHQKEYGIVANAGLVRPVNREKQGIDRLPGKRTWELLQAIDYRSVNPHMQWGWKGALFVLKPEKSPQGGHDMLQAVTIELPRANAKKVLDLFAGKARHNVDMPVIAEVLQKPFRITGM